MKIYLRLLKYVRPYWPRFALAMVFMVLLSGTTAAIAALAGPFVTYIVREGEKIPVLVWPLTFLQTLPKEELFYYFPFVILCISLVKGTSFYGQAYLMGYVGQKVINDLRNALYQHIQYLPMEFFTQTSTGAIMSRITNDVHLVQGAVTSAVTAVLRESLTIVALIFLIFYLDWKMATLAVCIFPFAVVVIVKVGKRLRRVTTKSQETYSRMSALMHETFSGTRIVKAFGMEQYESKKFLEETRRLFNNVLKAITTYSAFVPLMEFITILGLIGAFWYGGYRIFRGNLKPENFLSFFTALVMLYEPVKRLSGVNNAVQEGLAASLRIFEVLDTPSEIDLRSGATILRGFSRRIDFKKVSFRYEKDLVLRDITFEVKKRERVALVGMSGAGKTTVVNLLLRFYDAMEGTILIDGINIRDISLDSLRSQIGMVTQQIILFNDTVRNNIAYGDIGKANEEIVGAARAAYAHGFISALPMGYDTIIGEGGVKLSGGERQRISIARAILKNAPILVLDEATSSLDSESEEEVQKALDALMKDRTTFVIAHRLSTVRNADMILVLSKGRVVEMGRHEELLRRRGEYFKLYEKQFKEAPIRFAKKRREAEKRRVLA